MDTHAGRGRMTAKLITSLYTEAMLLADEARGYFDRYGREERSALDPLARVSFSCESLKVTTRLMHVVAWLLTQRAVEAGEMAPSATAASRRLGTAAGSDLEELGALPAEAQRIIAASIDLYSRVKRLDERSEGEPSASPARSLMSLLERSI